jgi:GNAT superfamily N-acetyltransferase
LVIVAHGPIGVVGFAHAQVVRPLVSAVCVEIAALVVGVSARRSGAGRVLVAAVESWAHELGITRLRVHSNVVRDEAHRFYPALGFELHKTQHLYAKTV